MNINIIFMIQNLIQILFGYKYDYIKELLHDKYYSFPYIKLNSMKFF